MYTTALTTALYYLTFVVGMAGAERSFYVVVVGVIVGTLTTLAIPPWAQFFRWRRPGVDCNRVCSAVLVVGISTSLVFLALRFLVSPLVGFLVYSGLQNASLTGQTFWRASALGWIVDEDCQAVQGRRRDAATKEERSEVEAIVKVTSGAGSTLGTCPQLIIVAGVSRTMLLAVSIFYFLVLNGLTLMGLDVTNCELACSAESDATKYECVAACDTSNFEKQPSGVRFIEVMYFAVVPLCQAMCAWLVYSFPIYGERLDAIYANQRRLYTRKEVGVKQDCSWTDGQFDACHVVHAQRRAS